MIHVHDGAVPMPMVGRLREALTFLPYQYGWKSNVERDWPGHWNVQIFVADKDNTKDMSPLLIGFQGPWAILREYWEWSAKMWWDSPPALLRYYSNKSTYGTEGYPHTDSNRPGEYTVLLYLVPEWKREWAGATAIWDEDETDVEHAILPAPNRLIIFPGTRQHAAWAVSRICPVARTVLVLKVRP